MRELTSETEDKSRKTFQKLHLPPVRGVLHITIKRSKNALFVISEPDVFKRTTADTYVVFGEAKTEDRALLVQDEAKNVIVRRDGETDKEKEDKKFYSALKKIGVSMIPGIEEVNMFKEDGEVVTLKNPEVQASIAANTYIISSQFETSGGT
jgi:nascent polypeptide-associated complex subunit alpha